MAPQSLHIARHIECPAGQAYAYAVDPSHLPVWAAGLGGSVEMVEGQWRVHTPDGDVVIAFAPANDYGVLDHDVVLPDGTAFYNPMRVIPDGDGCEVVFTLRRQPAMTDEDFERDAAAIAEDLLTLKRVLEAEGTG